MRVAMLPKQIVLVHAEEKVAAARGGVGSGKTLSLAWWTIREADRYPKASFAAVGASFTQLQTGFFVTLKGICDQYGIGYTFTTSPRPKLVFKESGATVESFSAEQREKLRSLEVDRVVVEEPQTWENGRQTFETLVERLRPSPSAAIHYPGMLPKIRMTFNPPVVGHWLYDLFEKKWRGVYPCYRMSLRENTLLQGKDPEYLPFLLATIPEERHAREIDGHWGTVATGVYRGFDSEKNTIEALRIANPTEPLPKSFPPFALDETKPIRWALDFNVGWMASVVCQIHAQPTITRFVPDFQPGSTKRIEEPQEPGYQDRIVYALREIFLSDAGVPNVVKEFLRLYGDVARKSGVVLYGDASGGGRSQAIDSDSAARSNWAIVLRDLRAAGIAVTMRVQRRNPAQLDRINDVREWFDMNGRVGFLCSRESCPELVNDFNLVQFVPGKNDIDKSDNSEDGVKRSHCFAPGTLVSAERGLIPIEDARPGERVWTRKGLRRVVNSGLTRLNAETLSVTMSNGATLRGTPDHPVFVPSRDAFVNLGELRPGYDVAVDSESTGTVRPSLAVAHVERVIASEKSAVYDLTVEGEPEFFANGVLVHNCSDALGYLLWVERQLAKKPKSVEWSMIR